MIEKKRWLLITFHTTSEAMAMEQRCQEAGLAGRLIPVPRTITADCGLAWRAELSLRPQLEALTQSMDVAGYYELSCKKTPPHPAKPGWGGVLCVCPSPAGLGRERAILQIESGFSLSQLA